jgi:hypothetical protein
MKKARVAMSFEQESARETGMLGVAETIARAIGSLGLCEQVIEEAVHDIRTNRDFFPILVVAVFRAFETTEEAFGVVRAFFEHEAARSAIIAPIAAFVSGECAPIETTALRLLEFAAFTEPVRSGSARALAAMLASGLLSANTVLPNGRTVLSMAVFASPHLHRVATRRIAGQIKGPKGTFDFADHAISPMLEAVLCSVSSLCSSSLCSDPTASLCSDSADSTSSLCSSSLRSASTASTASTSSLRSGSTASPASTSSLRSASTASTASPASVTEALKTLVLVVRAPPPCGPQCAACDAARSERVFKRLVAIIAPHFDRTDEGLRGLAQIIPSIGIGDTGIGILVSWILDSAASEVVVAAVVANGTNGTNGTIGTSPLIGAVARWIKAKLEALPATESSLVLVKALLQADHGTGADSFAFLASIAAGPTDPTGPTGPTDSTDSTESADSAGPASPTDSTSRALRVFLDVYGPSCLFAELGPCLGPGRGSDLGPGIGSECALSVLARRGEYATIKRLVFAADLRASVTGRTIVHIAVVTGTVASLAADLLERPNIAKATELLDSEGLTPAAYAARYCDENTARLLDPLLQAISDRTKQSLAAAALITGAVQEAGAITATINSLIDTMSPWSAALLVAIRRLSIGLSDLPGLTALTDSGPAEASSLTGLTEASGLTDSGLAEVTDSGLADVLALAGLTEVTGLQDSGLTDSGLTDLTDSGLTDSGLTDSGLTEVSTDPGLTEASGLQNSGLTALATDSDRTEVADVAEVSTEKKAADLVCFLISVGAARTYELKGDPALLTALCSIPLHWARHFASCIGKSFFAYLKAICAPTAAALMGGISSPVDQIIPRSYELSSTGLFVPRDTSHASDHKLMGIVFAHSIVAETDGPVRCGGVFCPAFLSDVVFSPHDPAHMSAHAFEARAGLHKIISPDVLWAMINIAQIDQSTFHFLINGVHIAREPVLVAPVASVSF